MPRNSLLPGWALERVHSAGFDPLHLTVPLPRHSLPRAIPSPTWTTQRSQLITETG